MNIPSSPSASGQDAMNTSADALTPIDDKNYFIYDQYGDNKMPPVGPIAILCTRGAQELGSSLNERLVTRRQAYLNYEDIQQDLPTGFIRDDYRVDLDLVRFSSGEGKAVINRSIRGHDVYILCDPMNYSCTYKMFGLDNHMSPDDHFQDLVRAILAASGRARRINVIMPFLYEGRQHRKIARESLDCAYMLEELRDLGITNFITFDAHDDRVFNSVPFSGFESIPTAYQIIKAIVRKFPDIDFNPKKMMVISPDEGAIGRSMYYASVLGLPLGTFYKRRDYSTIKDGHNPIVAHEFLGDSVEGLDVLIVDDMISSGGSMLDLAKMLKEGKANKVICAVSFALFTNGYEKFDKAYEEGLIDQVFATNLIYHDPELLAKPWYTDADFSKFLALIIDGLNHNASITTLLNSGKKIKRVIANHQKELGK